MHHNPPPRLVSVHITTPLTKSQRTGAATPTPIVFRSVKQKRSRKGGSLSNLLADFAAVARVRKLREAGVPV